MRARNWLPLLGLGIAIPFAVNTATAQVSENRGKLTAKFVNPSGKVTLRSEGLKTAEIILRPGAGTTLEILSASEMRRDYGTGGSSPTTYSGKVTMRLTRGKETILQMKADDVTLENLPAGE